MLGIGTGAEGIPAGGIFGRGGWHRVEERPEFREHDRADIATVEADAGPVAARRRLRDEGIHPPGRTGGEELEKGGVAIWGPIR